MSVEIKVPAKAIIFGEHFVVHGSYALVSSVDMYLRARATQSKGGIYIESNGRQVRSEYVLEVVKRILEGEGAEIIMTSDIPAGAGLGSSASFHSALVLASYALRGKAPPPEQVFSDVMELERHVHGNPSGVDVWGVLHGHYVLFKRGQAPRVFRLRQIRVGLVDSGDRRTTKELVRSASEIIQGSPHMQSLIKMASEVSMEGLEAIRSGDFLKLRYLIRANQAMLRLIGVSTKRIDELVEAMESEGVSAKITGAGGGGYLIAFPLKCVSGISVRATTMGLPGALELNSFYTGEQK